MRINVNLALLGLLSLSVAAGPAGCKSGSCTTCGSAGACCAGDDDAGWSESSVSLADLPAPVRATLEREAAGAPLTDIDKLTKGSLVRYEAEYASAGGSSYELSVNADGVLLSKTLENAETK